MSLLDYDALAATPLKTEPYDYFVVPHFVKREALPQVLADYPDVRTTGSIPPSELAIKGAFRDLLAELDGPEFRALIEDKFGIDLARRPTMFTVRGFCAKSNGKIHTDTASKIITVLLYMNDEWDADGGRLRILRNGTDLDDYAEEVSPNGGTLLVFRRSGTSWHGHEPFEGKRRAIQMNWVTDEAVVEHEQRRHRLSAFLKKINPFGNRAASDAY